MSDRIFDGHIFAEKLSKLNRSQQSIESLSHLCISHRKKARQIVETWDKVFCTAQREQRVSFLYLANDILQNSRRNGSEFVNEFWKVLPAALKHVYENGDENGKKEACRLVNHRNTSIRKSLIPKNPSKVGIWEERKVFGSRGQNLKDEMLGKHPPPSISNGRSSNPVKIVKRDDHSLRVKLSVGGMPEKILTAFQWAHDENVTEETALNKCKAAESLVGKMEKDVENTAQGNQQGSLLIEEIHEQENVLEQCVSQLENAEATRGALVSQLKEAIQEQELKLELIRTQLHVARGHIKHLGNMKHLLTSPPVPASLNAATKQLTESPLVVPTAHPTVTNQLSQPVISFASLKSSEEEKKKAAAAAVAAKLTASTSSAQMLTSILSSLVAEEAASMNTSGLKSAGFTSGLPMFSSEKRPRLENPLPVTDVNSSGMGSSTGYFASLHSIQTNQMQAPFPPPPPPPIPPGNSPANQFVQPSGVMMGVTPYAYGASSLPPPPPPLPSHIAQTLARPPPQPSLPQQQQAMNGGYYRPPGIGFHGQSHQSTPPPPVPRQ